MTEYTIAIFGHVIKKSLAGIIIIKWWSSVLLSITWVYSVYASIGVISLLKVRFWCWCWLLLLLHIAKKFEALLIFHILHGNRCARIEVFSLYWGLWDQITSTLMALHWRNISNNLCSSWSTYIIIQIVDQVNFYSFSWEFASIFCVRVYVSVWVLKSRVLTLLFPWFRFFKRLTSYV